MISANGNVTLKCEGIGREPIVYEWENKYIEQSKWKNVSNGDDPTNLAIMNIQRSQQYRCIVSNDAGMEISNVATITIMGKLFINISMTFRYISF